jgi:hypothetical protein
VAQQSNVGKPWPRMHTLSTHLHSIPGPTPALTTGRQSAAVCAGDTKQAAALSSVTQPDSTTCANRLPQAANCAGCSKANSFQEGQFRSLSRKQGVVTNQTQRGLPRVLASMTEGHRSLSRDGTDLQARTTAQRTHERGGVDTQTSTGYHCASGSLVAAAQVRN